MAGLEKLARDKRKEKEGPSFFRILFSSRCPQVRCGFFTRGDFDALLFPLGDPFFNISFYGTGEDVGDSLPETKMDTLTCTTQSPH